MPLVYSPVRTISNNLVNNYPELKALFNGINPNDILKVNTDDLDTILTNKAFDWQSNDFYLQGFDAKSTPYNVSEWYYLSANLQLDFTCLGENAKVNKTTISQTYDMYFANDGSDLTKVVTVVSNNIQEKLDNIKFVKLDYPQWDDSFVNQENDVLPKINADLKTKMAMSKLEIGTKSITNPYNNDYNYMNTNGDNSKQDYFPLTLRNSQNFIKNSTDFNNAWNKIIADRESDFVSRLNIWETNNKLTITDKDNVFVFGKYQTINWKINGLEIKTLSVPYYITSTNTTRASNTAESLPILEKLFAGPDALFQYGRNYLKTGNWDFSMCLNPDVYDDFMNKNVPVQEIYDYVTKQTKDFGTKHKFIQSTDKVQWTSGNTNWLNNTISSERIVRQTDKNWRLVINGNAFAMSLNVNSGTMFHIIRAATDVWPN